MESDRKVMKKRQSATETSGKRLTNDGKRNKGTESDGKLVIGDEKR